MKRILFICLGNICRSPMAEAVMRKLVEENGLEEEIEVDSAGLISYHEGEGSDPRMKDHAFRYGYRLTHISRPITTDDFHSFDMIICMDDSNWNRLHRLAPNAEAASKISKMTDYCTNHVATEVPDPYYGGSKGFEFVIELLEDACEGLIQSIIHN